MQPNAQNARFYTGFLLYMILIFASFTHPGFQNNCIYPRKLKISLKVNNVMKIEWSPNFCSHKCK